MEAESRRLGLDRVGIDILELGSGVGWLGMCLAANLDQANTVTCSEQAAGGAIEWLHKNIDMNCHLDLSNLRCCVCDWSWFDPSSTHATGSPGNSSQPPRTPGSPAALLNAKAPRDAVDSSAGGVNMSHCHLGSSSAGSEALPMYVHTACFALGV